MKVLSWSSPALCCAVLRCRVLCCAVLCHAGLLWYACGVRRADSRRLPCLPPGFVVLLSFRSAASDGKLFSPHNLLAFSMLLSPFLAVAGPAPSAPPSTIDLLSGTIPPAATRALQACFPVCIWLAFALIATCTLVGGSPGSGRVLAKIALVNKCLRAAAVPAWHGSWCTNPQLPSTALLLAPHFAPPLTAQLVRELAARWVPHAACGG